MSIQKKTILINVFSSGIAVFFILAFYSAFIDKSNIDNVTTMLFFISGFFIIAVNICLTMYVIRSISYPINQLIHATKEIGQGNLDYVISYDYNDEFTEVINEYNKMRLSLKEITIELQEQNYQKKQFTDSIVHDLKTPISSVLGYSQALLDNIATTEEKKMQFIKMIYEKTKNIDQLVNTLFSISVMENNLLTFNIESVSTKKFTNYMRTLEDGLIVDNIKTSISYNFNSEKYILLDFDHTKRVFQNIIENSMKYKSEDDLEINFEINERNKRLILKITDNGIGLTKDEEEKIFQKFYRSDKARSNNTGSGLGLTTCKYIMEGQSGEIWARCNEHARGLAIYLSFPME